MKILITGAGGQIGHDLIGALVAAGHHVVSTDKSINGKYEGYFRGLHQYAKRGR